MIIRKHQAASLEDIRSFEHDLGIILPLSYKQFLSTYNGGFPKPANFRQGDFVNEVLELFPLCVDAQSDLREEWQDAQLYLPADYLPIGRDIGGERICLLINNGSNSYGHVFVSEGYLSYNRSKVNMQVLSHSYESFLKSLYYAVEEDVRDDIQILARYGSKADFERFAHSDNISRKSKRGFSLLCEAISHSNDELIHACINAGVPVTGALHMAVRNRRWDLLEHLIASGADINEIDSVTGEKAYELVFGLFGQNKEKILNLLKPDQGK